MKAGDMVDRARVKVDAALSELLYAGRNVPNSLVESIIKLRDDLRADADRLRRRGERG